MVQHFAIRSWGEVQFPGTLVLGFLAWLFLPHLMLSGGMLDEDEKCVEATIQYLTSLVIERL